MVWQTMCHLCTTVHIQVTLHIIDLARILAAHLKCCKNDTLLSFMFSSGGEGHLTQSVRKDNGHFWQYFSKSGNLHSLQKEGPYITTILLSEPIKTMLRCSGKHNRRKREYTRVESKTKPPGHTHTPSHFHVHVFNTYRHIQCS